MEAGRRQLTAAVCSRGVVALKGRGEGDGQREASPGGVCAGAARGSILYTSQRDMKSYRTLVLKYPLEKLQPEAVVQLLKA